MKLYLIAIAVAILGLFASSKVQAESRFCGGEVVKAIDAFIPACLRAVD